MNDLSFIVKLVLNYEDMRKFESLKRVGQKLLFTDRTEREKAAYFAVLDEMCIIYCGFDEKMRNQLKLEHPDIHNVFDMFDEAESKECARDQCKPEEDRKEA